MRQPHVYHPTNPIPRAQPAHHFVRANRCYPSSQAGRAWKPAPTLGGEGECVQPPSSVIRRKGRRGRRPLRWFAYFTLRHVTQGRSPRTILYGRPMLSFIPGRAGVEARPYGVFGRAKRTGLRTGPFCAEMPAGVSGRVFYEYSSPEKARMETRTAATAAMASMKTVNQSVLMPKAAIISSISFTSAAPAAVTRQSIRA